MRALILAVLATSVNAPSDKAVVIPMVAFGPWKVDSNDKLCLLSRTFGKGDAAVEVGFQPIFNNETMEILLLSSSKAGQQHSGTAKLRFLPSNIEISGNYYSLPTKPSARRLTHISVSTEAFSLLQSSTELAISAKPESVTLQLPKAEKAVTAFRQCEAALLRSWNVDPAATTLERAAKALNPERAFDIDSYPPEARKNGWIGRVVAVVQIDARGAPIACRVVAGVAAPLNEATCRGAMTRVKFRPGTDASGKPAASVTVLSVEWQLFG